MKLEAIKMEALIKEEHAKIAAYEAAFQQIKEATGVSDVNEVIQRFLLQEETHQNLLSMTRSRRRASTSCKRARRGGEARGHGGRVLRRRRRRGEGNAGHGLGADAGGAEGARQGA